MQSKKYAMNKINQQSDKLQKKSKNIFDYSKDDTIIHNENDEDYDYYDECLCTHHNQCRYKIKSSKLTSDF